MISFEYGWIRSGEVIIETSKAKDVDGIKLLGAVQGALELSEHPVLEQIQCSGINDEPMTADRFVALARATNQG